MLFASLAVANSQDQVISSWSIMCVYSFVLMQTTVFLVLASFPAYTHDLVKAVHDLVKAVHDLVKAVHDLVKAVHDLVKAVTLKRMRISKNSVPFLSCDS